MAADSERLKELFDRINAAFHALGPEPYANINRLTRLCGELLGADAALYYRLQKDSLFAIGRWGLPEDFSAVVPCNNPCAGALLASQGLRVQRAEDPHCAACAALGVRNCVGRPVLSEGKAIGILCALYKTAYAPEPLHDQLINLVTAALAVEEERLRMERARQKLSEELRHSQKMEAIGLLAGGVAHDFNNALTAIRGNAELLKGIKNLPEAAREEALEISKAAEYAATLTRQLLTFSRKQTAHPQILDLNETVSNLAKILRRTVGENISVELELAERLDCLRADPGQLEQIVMNLAVNARDAMPEGGVLKIRTEAVDFEGLEAPAAIREAPGRYLALSVSDTGVGMAPDVLQRLFEPFFTTKEQGKGTGLGLSTVYGIVRQNNGDIVVSSAVGKGSTFRVLLPAVKETAASGPAGAGQAGPRSKGEKILLVEDEASVRALVGRVLSSAGYQVLEARHGKEALLLAAKERDIDVLVTDIVMPEMNGYHLSQEILKAFPNIRILFMSGYADEAMLKAASSTRNSSIMMKPFSPTDLLDRIRSLRPA